MFIETKKAEDHIEWHTESAVGYTPLDKFEKWIIKNGRNKIIQETKKADQSGMDEKEHTLTFEYIMSDENIWKPLLKDYVEEKNAG